MIPLFRGLFSFVDGERANVISFFRKRRREKMEKSTQRLQQALQDVVERYHAAGYFPDAAVRVFDREKTLAVCCAGSAKADDLFDVASLTKIATATQIFHLIQREKIRLEDEIGAYFPEISDDGYLSRRFAGVTVYRLLTHTSTLAAWYPFYSRLGEEFFSVLQYALKHTQPTEGVVYSDLNFMLLGKLLEKIQEKPLARCLREDLAEPLRLGKMTYHPAAEESVIPSCYGNPIEERMCAERGISFDGFRPQGVPVRGTVNDGNSHYYFGDEAGHAGIFATAEAYERLCRYYMNTQDELLQSAQREQKAAPGRGMGFQTGMTYPHGCGHTGFTGTAIFFSRAYNVGVVSFTNRLYFPQGNGHDLSEFRRALHEAMFALCAQSPR